MSVVGLLVEAEGLLRLAALGVPLSDAQRDHAQQVAERISRALDEHHVAVVAMEEQADA